MIDIWDLLHERRTGDSCGQEMGSCGGSASSAVSKWGFFRVPLASHSEIRTNATGQILFSVTPMQPS